MSSQATDYLLPQPAGVGLDGYLPDDRPEGTTNSAFCLPYMTGTSGNNTGTRDDGNWEVPMDCGIRVGNAGIDGADHRGWFVGHFMAGPDDLRFTDAVEVKWGVHERGEGKPQWASNTKATTMSVLIKGRFRITFPNEETLLAQEGDYVMWAPGVPHIWAAEDASVVLTVRWPSEPGDSSVVADGTS